MMTSEAQGPADRSEVRTLAGTFALDEWVEMLTSTEPATMWADEDGNEEYDSTRFAVVTDEDGVQRLRELADAEIAANRALDTAVDAHRDQLTHPDVIEAFELADAARETEDDAWWEQRMAFLDGIEAERRAAAEDD